MRGEESNREIEERVIIPSMPLTARPSATVPESMVDLRYLGVALIERKSIALGGAIR
jgi:hypothetical protein